MMLVKTEAGTLLDGIPFDGVLHTAFEIRLLTMKGTGEALDLTDEKFDTVEGYAADSFFQAAKYVGALVRLGDIPAASLTAELLYEHLTRDDADQFDAAVKRLKAKRSGGNPGSPDSALPSSP